jgi:hypothetical protein
LDGRVPEKYYPQVLHQLLVTGAVAWHYVSQGDERSFHMAKRLAIVLVVPRRDELQALLDLEIAFMATLEVVNFLPKFNDFYGLGQLNQWAGLLLALPSEQKLNSTNGLRREEPGESARFLDSLSRSLAFSRG